MLDAKTLEWLEKRKNLCIRCPKKNYCRTGKKHNFNTRDCRFWEIYAPSEKLWNHELRENFKDAAEFEARVTAKLAYFEDGCTPCSKPKKCPFENLDIIECVPCRLKYARLAVEEEMQ